MPSLKNQSGIIPLVVLAIVGAVSASGVTVAASQKSIPGDALYPVKKATENIRVAAAFSKQDKAKVQIAIAEEKVKEIEKLEEKGRTDEIAEAAQELKDSQDNALELTQSLKTEGQKVDELEKLLEVQSGKQQIVLTKISDNIPQQINESLSKSLKQFREQLKVTVESDDEDEKEKEEDSGPTPTPTPCPSPSSSEDENNYQDYEDTSNEEDEEEEWKKYQYYDDEDVRGISQLRNSQGSSSGAGAGSQTFDGGAGSPDDNIAPESPNDPCDSVKNPSANPTVKGVSTNGGLLQLILNVLFNN